jgi:hypothetical protein
MRQPTRGIRGVRLGRAGAGGIVALGLGVRAKKTVIGDAVALEECLTARSAA